jgi:hypothetical protein
MQIALRALLAFASFSFLTATLARAEAPARDLLTDDESVTMCAEELPKDLECKKEFCAAMVKIRAGDKTADLKAMEAKCLDEIAVDGTGDLAARKARCAGWMKSHPKMSMTQAEAKEMSACWTKASCGDRVACWAPHKAKQMGKARDAAPKK